MNPWIEKFCWTGDDRVLRLYSVSLMSWEGTLSFWRVGSSMKVLLACSSMMHKPVIDCRVPLILSSTGTVFEHVLAVDEGALTVVQKLRWLWWLFPVLGSSFRVVVSLFVASGCRVVRFDDASRFSDKGGSFWRFENDGPAVSLSDEWRFVDEN